ncbi:MAG: GNAT family protein [Actinomycetota bacterium]|nr:GNAT family protein [Actinomycetota bacterium]
MAAMTADALAIWPLTGLAVVTPRVRLRYITDELGFELAQLAAQGIHHPSTMPFATPWTDVPSPELERNTMRFYWRSRAETCIAHWDLQLAVLVDGAPIGMCSIAADSFQADRSVETGSWIGRHHQGRGFGREARQAVLHLIFAGLDADRATTGAWHDNAASLAVTRSLPYVRTGTSVQPRRGRPDTMLNFAMSRTDWDGVRRSDISLVGVEPVRDQLATARGGIRGPRSA